MELPQTQLIIRHLNARIQNHLVNANLSWKCIPEKCNKIMTSANCSCSSNLTNITCHNVSDPKIPVILWSLSSVILVILIVELIAIRCNFSYLKNFIGKMLFLMGIVSSVVTQLCTVPYLKDNSNDITVYYNMALGIISILFTVFGFTFLFERCPDGNIGSHDKGMGLVLAIITVPLVILETVLLVEIFRTRHLNNILGGFLLVWIVEKVVQVTIYVLIRKCKPLPEYNDGAIFYLIFLSFVNFTMWLNAIPFTDIKLYDEVSKGENPLWLVDRTFKALVIDYRLLSTLLFLEHAIVLSETNGRPHVHMQDDNEFQPPEKRRWYTFGGISVGLFCLLLEITNGIQFWLDVPAIVNLGPIVSDVILVFFGCLLLYYTGSKISHNQNVSLIILMVTSMGAVSVIYLVIFGLLCIVIIINNSESEVKDHHDYVIWSTAMFFIRAISLLVLLVVYSGVPFSVMESTDNQRNTKNYVITWALFGGLLARVVGSILDEFHGTMHKIAHHHVEPQHLRALKDLFNIGPLFQLATSLHLALHFLLMILRLHKPPRNPVVPLSSAPASDDEGPPLRQQATHDDGHAGTSGGEILISSDDTTTLVSSMKVV